MRTKTLIELLRAALSGIAHGSRKPQTLTPPTESSSLGVHGLMPKAQVEIKYVWLDEDHEEVSPRHAEFKTALSFITGWHARWHKTSERAGGVENLQHHFVAQMTKTGKPPVHLTRLVVTAEYKPLDEGERITLQAFWQTARAIEA